MNTDTNVSFVTPCTNSTEEARNYLQRRFMIAKTSPSTQYVDTFDNQRDLQRGAVIGILCSKFGLSYESAKGLLRHTNIRYWSGQDIYAPNEPVVVERHHKHHLNLWKRSEITSNNNESAQPFVNHLKLALSNDEEVDFVLDILAYRYQNPKPARKPHHALYLYSEQQGQGKSLFKDTIETVFGRSAVKISTNVRELTGQSAYQFWSRTWLIVEEVKVGSDTRLYDAIKAMSGADVMDADPKHKTSIEVEIPAQLIMLSNRAPLFIEEEDRRFFVAEWDTGLRGDAKTKYFDGYIDWLENGGFEAVAALLANRDLSGYKAGAHAPMTTAKAQCLDEGLPLAVEELIEYLDSCPEQLVFTPAELSSLLSRIPTQEQKRYLEIAGLCKGRKAISKSNPTLYWRKDCQIRKINGAWEIINKEQSYPLETASLQL